jgi:hypothetical protein
VGMVHVGKGGEAPVEARGPRTDVPRCII